MPSIKKIEEAPKYVHQAWPSWRYGPNGKSGVFNHAEEVPDGWVDNPANVGKAAATPKATPPVGPSATEIAAKKAADDKAKADAAAKVKADAEAKQAELEAKAKLDAEAKAIEDAKPKTAVNPPGSM